MTRIVMNNNCDIPLIETDMEFGDRHYIWGQIRSKVMTLKPFLYEENYIAVYMYESFYYIFVYG